MLFKSMNQGSTNPSNLAFQALRSNTVPLPLVLATTERSLRKREAILEGMDSLLRRGTLRVLGARRIRTSKFPFSLLFLCS